MPAIAVDPSGNAVATWQRFNGTNQIIQGATLASGSTTWISTTDLSAVGKNASQPNVAVDASGNAVAIWQRSNGTNTIIQGAKLAFGSTTWTSTTDLSAVGQNASLQSPGNPSLTVDPSGNAVAVWERSNGTNNIIQGATLASGSTTWTSTTDLSAVGEDASNPYVRVDGSGNAVAIWQRSNGTNTIIQGATLSFGSTTWAATNDLSAVGQTAGLSQLGRALAVNPSGTAVAGWDRSNGANLIAQASTSILPPTVTSISPNSGIYHWGDVS